MAQAMAAIGNGGTLYQSRLVAQVQGLENQIIAAYDVRARSDLGIDKKSMAAIRKACINVVSGAAGTVLRDTLIAYHGSTGVLVSAPDVDDSHNLYFMNADNFMGFTSDMPGSNVYADPDLVDREECAPVLAPASPARGAASDGGDIGA